MSKLVDTLVNDPNSPFAEEDADALKQMPPGLLQRILAGMQPPEQTQEASLRAELKTCQEDIINLLASEKEIRKELEEHGILVDSVLTQIMPSNMPQGNGSQEVATEELVQRFVNTSSSPMAEMIREGLDARKQGRSKAVQTIQQATNSFTVEELDKMSTKELLKWAEVLRIKRSSQFETPVYNWEGAGVADMSGNQSGGYLGAPLSVQSTSPVRE